jgi:hypothetical protein
MSTAFYFSTHLSTPLLFGIISFALCLSLSLRQGTKLAEIKEDATSYANALTIAPPIDAMRMYFGEQVCVCVRAEGNRNI